MSRGGSDELLLAVAEIARQRFGWQGRLEPGTRIIEDLGLDSLKALEMIVEIENRFRIRIDAQAEGEIVTVGDLVAVIEAERASGGTE